MPLFRKPRTYTSIVNTSDYTLTAALGVQSAFPAAQDAFTLEPNTTYKFKGQYYITNGTTTHTTAMAFSAAGGLSVTSIKYQVNLFSSALNSTGTTQTSISIDTISSTVINATSPTAGTMINFEGMIAINAGGTLTPQINFSANPTGTNLMKIGSYISFESIGSGTVSIIGAIS